MYVAAVERINDVIMINILLLFLVDVGSCQFNEELMKSKEKHKQFI